MPETEKSFVRRKVITKKERRRLSFMVLQGLLSKGKDSTTPTPSTIKYYTNLAKSYKDKMLEIL